MIINRQGVNNAKRLIRQGKVNKKSPWSLSYRERKRLLPNMFLAKDSESGELKYPFGKGGKVYRSALIAAKQRAGQQKDQRVLNQADRLLKLVDGKSNDFSDDYFLYGTFGADIKAKNVIDEIKDLGEFNLRINSPGGSVMEGYAIYNYVKSKGIKPKVYVDSFCGSIATVVACCGEVIMPENTMFMIHNPSSFAMGEKKDFLKEVEVLEKLTEGIIGIYADKTGLDRDKIEEMMDDETWLTAKEAKELGFCDVIADKVDIRMDFDLDRYFNKVPNKLKRRNNVDKFLLKKAEALGVDVKDKDESVVMAEVVKAYENKVRSLEVATTISELENRVGSDFAIMLGKVAGSIEEETFEAIVAKIENLQKIVDEIGEKQSDGGDVGDVVGDDVVMKKVKEIAEKEGLSEASAIVELAKREPELMAKWR